MKTLFTVLALAALTAVVLLNRSGKTAKKNDT
jgi:hypothetical protein